MLPTGMGTLAKPAAHGDLVPGIAVIMFVWTENAPAGLGFITSLQWPPL